mmetsp:Transcript_5781/g.12782  ORF Transcript_5781/g.12782 Transcript_5781/m.12782 type:complete len:200 (+) Transcript_5781:947-1546(+)
MWHCQPIACTNRVVLISNTSTLPSGTRCSAYRQIMSTKAKLLASRSPAHVLLMRLISLRLTLNPELQQHWLRQLEVKKVLCLWTPWSVLGSTSITVNISISNSSTKTNNQPGSSVQGLQASGCTWPNTVSDLLSPASFTPGVVESHVRGWSCPPPLCPVVHFQRSPSPLPTASWVPTQQRGPDRPLPPPACCHHLDQQP